MNLKGLPTTASIEENVSFSPLPRTSVVGNFFTMTYQEKLQDPKWQKKRLQVFKRDKFKCVLCSDGEETLNVHHLQYHSGRDPWDYPLANFQTLCRTCHKIAEHVKGFKELPTSVIYLPCDNYTAVYVTMTGDQVIRYTYDDDDQNFTPGGILTHEEMKLLTAKKRCKNG